jgi:RHS repeat-associated protein
MKIKTWWLLAGAVLIGLTPHEALAGACLSARFHNWMDMGCNGNYTGTGGPTTPLSCGKPGCDKGMPRWWVSEPYIDLHLSDTPLSYQTSSGQNMDFQFFYRQRAKLPEDDEISGYHYYLNGALQKTRGDVYATIPNCGTNAAWNNNWNMSIQIWDPSWEGAWTVSGTQLIAPLLGKYPVYSGGYQALVYQPDGGIDFYNVQSNSLNSINAQTRVIFTNNTAGVSPVVEIKTKIGNGSPQISNIPVPDTNGIYWGDSGIGISLVRPDGSRDVFSLSANIVIASPVLIGQTSFGNSTERLFLTRRIDPQGRVTQLGYEYVTDLTQLGCYFYRLRYVVDPDHRTNTFLYTSGLQLGEIDDPYGRKVSLGRDSSGRLGSIVDAVGQTNYFGYQGANGWINKLSTPYGDTSFFYYELADSSATEPDCFSQRALYISEPEGAHQLYLYQHQNSAFMAANETAPANIPGQTNFDNGSTGGTSGHGALSYRNTFHWGRRQFDALPYYYVQEYLGEVEAYPAGSDSMFSQALGQLSAADYNKARMRHWLMSSSDNLSITEALSSERDPSPDAAGTIPGLRTWYNYPGKPSPELTGASLRPTCIARLLPDGTSQYTTYNYYPSFYPPGGAGLVSDNESSYSLPDGSIGVLTNRFTYAANSVDLASISNSAGQYVNYGYNGSHQIQFVTNALNQVTTLSWDEGNTWNLTGLQFPAGKSISLSYYPASLPPTSTSALLQQISIAPEGRTFTLNNYQAGNPANITDDRGLTVANTWDGLNRLTGTSFPDNTTSSNIYYRLDLVATQDRLGNWTRYAYDGLQHLTTATNANNAITTYSWCGCGSLESILDALTNLTTLNYDNQGNLTNVVFPDYSSLTWQFDLAGRMTNAFDGANRWLQVAYNNQGLPTTVTGANGLLRQTVYDALNRPTRITDANGVTVTNTFDAINELLKRTWLGGSGTIAASEGYGYSAAGLMAYTNRDQKVSFYGRDGAGRLTTVTNANQEVTQFGYDSLDSVISLMDGLQHQTTWQYNQYGWLTNKVDGLNRNAFRYAYNPNGWVTNRWTPEKGNTGYTYDNVGNLTNVTYASQPSPLSYAYDALNRLTNMVDAVGTNSFSYTPAGQLQSENGPWANDTLTYTYVQGLRTALTLSQTSGNWSQSYGYDSGWRLQTLTSPAGSFNYSYNFQPASSLVTGIQLPNGANIVNSYDGLARLRQTSLNNYWGHPLDSYGYTPDALGLRTNIVRNLGLTSSTVTAGFDNIGQLTSWNAAEAGGTPRQNEQLGFGYDAAHNLHTRNNGNLAQTFTTDAANQLNGVTRIGTFTLSGATPAPATSVTVNGQAAQIYGDFTFARTNLTLADGSNTFTNIAQNVYGVKVTNTLTLNLPQSVGLNSDANGSLTNDGVRVFGYNAENQLTNVTVANKFKKNFVYDGLNRLRIKREYGWTGSTWTQTNEVHFIYDGNSIIQHRDSNNVPILTLTRGLDLSGSLHGAGGIGGLLAMTDGTGVNYYYHSDGSGNVTALMDAQENIVARREYDAFGRTINLTGTKPGINAYWYSSQLYDEDTRLVHFKYRDYTPDLMRFLSDDPLQETGGINLFCFVRNNPVNNIDTDGRQVVGIAGTGAATATGAATTTGTATAGGAGITATVTAVETGVAEFGTAGTLGLGTLAASGGLLIGDMIGVQRDAELYPSGVNGPAMKAKSPLPMSQPTLPAIQPKDCPPQKTPPQIFYHYSNNPDLAGGNLFPGQGVTTVGNMSSKDAMFNLGIDPPKYVYLVTLNNPSAYLVPDIGIPARNKIPAYEVIQPTPTFSVGQPSLVSP